LHHKEKKGYKEERGTPGKEERIPHEGGASH